jgi:hypothetical protein
MNAAKIESEPNLRERTSGERPPGTPPSPRALSPNSFEPWLKPSHRLGSYVRDLCVQFLSLFPSASEAFPTATMEE